MSRCLGGKTLREETKKIFHLNSLTNENISVSLTDDQSYFLKVFVTFDSVAVDMLLFDDTLSQ